MKRRLYDALLSWKKMGSRKPLVLMGARQVGKTYLLEKFGKQEFSKTISLNFERQPYLERIFEKDLSVKRIVREIEIEHNSKIEPENTLIILDEIQECPQALGSLKYFCEEGAAYYVVAAGSLLGLRAGGESFPVGKVHFLELFPLSFGEFLLAMGEEELTSCLLDFKKIEPISENLHLKCLDYLRLYYCTGGMPEVVKNYIEKEDLNRTREIQFDLLGTFANDFSKHPGKAAALRIGQLWNSIPRQLAKEQKKFKYSDIKKGGRAKDYEDAIAWLTTAHLCHEIWMVSRPELPLSHFTAAGFFKMILLDVGLLGAMSLIPTQVILKETDSLKTFKGFFTESFIGQELKAHGVKNLYYWKSEYEAEVDYLIERSGEIYPVEVKSGESGKLKSLNIYARKYSPKYKVRISSKNYFCRDDFINLPLYGVEQLLKAEF